MLVLVERNEIDDSFLLTSSSPDMERRRAVSLQQLSFVQQLITVAGHNYDTNESATHICSDEVKSQSCGNCGCPSFVWNLSQSLALTTTTTDLRQHDGFRQDVINHCRIDSLCSVTAAIFLPDCQSSSISPLTHSYTPCPGVARDARVLSLDSLAVINRYSS